MRGSRKVLAATATLAATAATILTMPVASAATGPSVQAQLAGARQSTAALHDTTRAAAAGWVDTGLPCFDNPGTGEDSGGMGVHWVRAGETLTEAPDPQRPNVLVFDPVTLRLVAVEYVVVQSAVPGRPELFGHEFGAEVLPDGTPIYELHAYVWQQNPNGMFADYNPNVHLCP